MGARLSAAPAVLLVLAALACAVNPVTGEREVVLMSSEQEASTGREAAAEVEREIGLVADPELAAYVSAIGARLAALSPRRDVGYRFQVVNMPEANAFALPGGYVYVSRGLLALTNSEAELANVIGHEIGHVAARHSASRQTRALGVGLLSVLGTIAAGALGGPGAAATAAQVGQVAGAGLIASYGRDQERDADRIGQGIAARAGWDPAAMAGFLRAMERQTALQRDQRMPSFFDSHPATPERASAAAALARTLAAGSTPQIAATRAQFLAKLDGILVGPDPAEGIVRESVFLHAGADFRIRFPTDWKVHNGRDTVTAMSPRQNAVIQLMAQEKGDDPRAAAQHFQARERIRFSQAGSVRLGTRRGYRAVAVVATQQGQLGLDLYWLAHGGTLYRIQGVAPEDNFPAYAELFSRTVESFRELSDEERRGLRPRRLAIARAREGEPLVALSNRSGNVWSLEETAVMNGLNQTSTLHAGESVKIAVVGE